MASDRTQSTRLAEFLGLVSFALALMLLISLGHLRPDRPRALLQGGRRAAPRATSSAPSARSWPSCWCRSSSAWRPLLLPLVLGITGLEALLVPAHRGPLHQGLGPPAAAALAHRVPGAGLRHRARRGRAGARGRRLGRAARRRCSPPASTAPAPSSCSPPACSSRSSWPRSSPSPRSCPRRGRARGRARAVAAHGLGPLQRDAAQGEACAGRSSRSTRRRRRTPRRPRREPAARAQGAARRPTSDLEDEGERAAAAPPPARRRRAAAAAVRRHRPRWPRGRRVDERRRRSRRRKRGSAPRTPPATPRRLHAAAHLDPGRDPVRRRHGQGSACSRRRSTLQSKCGEFGVMGTVVEIHPGPGGHHLRVQARRGRSSTRRSWAWPTTSRWPWRRSPSASTA